VSSELARYGLEHYWLTFAKEARELGAFDDARLYEEAALVVWRRGQSVTAWPWPASMGGCLAIYRGLSPTCEVCGGQGWIPGSEHMGHVERLGCYGCDGQGAPFTVAGAERRRLSLREARP
jgi:hypothetical protein